MQLIVTKDVWLEEFCALSGGKKGQQSMSFLM